MHGHPFRVAICLWDTVMTEYTAHATHAELALGVSFSVASTSLFPGDSLRFEAPGNHRFVGVVETFNIGVLTLVVDGHAFTCRPWQGGDESPHRPDGPSSAWTVH